MLGCNCEAKEAGVLQGQKGTAVNLSQHYSVTKPPTVALTWNSKDFARTGNNDREKPIFSQTS